MLLSIILTSVFLSTVLCSEGTEKKVKPYMFPVPFELPIRNERAEQCWLRIEDIELTETIAIYCYIAHGFLRNHIHDYNSRKMTEDGVDVSLWIEKPRSQEDLEYNRLPEMNQNSIKDWKVTTIMDPVTRMRLYVSKDADCRLIMNSRESTSNYKVECERILFFVNDRLSGSAVFSCAQNLIMAACLFLVYVNSCKLPQFI